MKKLMVLFAVTVIVMAFAYPVFANDKLLADSWEYGAVAQLAAKGDMPEYPEGLVGEITRLEAAYIIANTLVNNKNEYDANMLEKLVNEFNEELLELGVRVDSLDDVSINRP